MFTIAPTWRILQKCWIKGRNPSDKWVQPLSKGVSPLSDFQTAFFLFLLRFLGNPLHSQGVLFMMEFPNKLTAENAPVARFFVSTPIICLPHFRFLGCDRFQVMGVRVAAMPRTLL